MTKKSHRQNKTDVLISGAGPAGLMMACQLALHNISSRIIEKKKHYDDYSGALLIQARTLELFDQMGIADEMIRRGQVIENIIMIREGRKSGQINIGKMGVGLSRFPYILMVKQSHTRKLLCEYLEKHEIEVEMDTSLDQFSLESQFVNIVLDRAGGKKENLKTRFLIGADGTHSQVRTGLGIRWEGIRDPVPLFVTDCQVSETPDDVEKGFTASIGKPKNNIIFSISKKSIAGFFPLEEKNWRIDGLIPSGVANHKKIDFEDATQGLAQRLKMNMTLHSPEWFSVFYPNTFLASTYNVGQCFLVGDAAHVHTPIGAQGMNTGLQDSYNLAWKMAFVLKYRVSESILKTYTSERRPIAEKLIQSTDKYFSLAIKNDLPSRLVRNYFLPWFIKHFNFFFESKRVQRAFFLKISQTGLRYEDAVSWAGKRWPFIEWDDKNGNKKDTHELLDCRYFTLIAFQFGNSVNHEVETAFHSYFMKFKLPLQLKTISHTKETKDMFQKLHIHKSNYFLVRPDGYITLQGQGLDFRPVATYLENLVSSVG